MRDVGTEDARGTCLPDVMISEKVPSLFQAMLPYLSEVSVFEVSCIFEMLPAALNLTVPLLSLRCVL